MDMERNRREFFIVFAISAGIILRYIVMSFGNNGDFVNYCTVGELVVSGKNVYANTAGYNYGPLFFWIQGFCYYLARVSENPILTFRVLLIGFLIVADVVIMLIVYAKFGYSCAIVFFLNPVSILITGYHNQFDNLAIALLMLSLIFYNKEPMIGKKDIMFLGLFSLSLIMKHIFFIFPLWILLSTDVPVRKKFLYAFIPPMVFLISFIPFAAGDYAAVNGILENVFFYRSYNNAPLLKGIYTALGIGEQYYFFIFSIVMIAIGSIIRRYSIDYKLFIYLISMVAFSSAVANQYLAIPVVALAVLSKKASWVYGGVIGYFLVCHPDGLHLGEYVRKPLVNVRILGDFLNYISNNGWYIACLILFMILLKELWINTKQRRAYGGRGR